MYVQIIAWIRFEVVDYRGLESYFLGNDQKTVVRMQDVIAGNGQMTGW